MTKCRSCGYPITTTLPDVTLCPERDGDICEPAPKRSKQKADLKPKLKWKRDPMPVTRTAPRRYDLVGAAPGLRAAIERMEDGGWYFYFRRHAYGVKIDGYLPTLARCKAFCEGLANGRIAP